KQLWKFDQWRDALDSLFAQEWTAFLFGKAQRALPRLVIDQQQEVDLLKRARRSALALRAASFHSAHKSTSPPVRRRVADGAEHRRVGRRVERAGPQLQRRLQREPRG